MPNPKKPSERLKEAIEPFLNEEDKTENEMFKELCQIIDDQHQEIQSLQKEVEELKKLKTSCEWVGECEESGKHYHVYSSKNITP